MSSPFFPKPVTKKSGPGKPGGSRSGENGRSGHSRSDRDGSRPSRPERSDRGDSRSERSDRRDRSDRPERSERQNRSDRPDHSDRRRSFEDSPEKRRPFGGPRKPRSNDGPARGFDRKPPEDRRPAPRAERPVPKEKDDFAPFEDASAQSAPLLPGVKPVLELLEEHPDRVDAVFLKKGRHTKDMERIVDLCREAKVRFSLLEPTSFARIYSGKSQGVVARLFEGGFTDEEELLDSVMDAPLPLIIVLDQVQDPGNAGALARTLYALGGAGLVVPRHNGVYLGAAASKTAAGALERLPVSKVASLSQFVDTAKKRGFTVYGAEGAPEAGTPVHSVNDFVPRLPALLILGSEEDGMRQGMEKRCDALIRIPMLRDFDSLNVAQAGGIIIAAFAARKIGK